MIVSQFEAINWPNSKVRRQYLLYLTCLADREYRFRMTFRTASTYALDETWHFSWNSSATSSWGSIQRIGPEVYISKFWLNPRPHDTVSISLLPNDEAVDTTIRGYIELSIPPFSVDGSFEPQGDAPVPVLLQAVAVSGQERSAIPISTGTALNEIMPEQSIELASLLPLPEAGGSSNELRSTGRQPDYAGFIADPHAASNVVAYLAAAGQSAEGVKHLNEMLERGGHRIRLRNGR